MQAVKETEKILSIERHVLLRAEYVQKDFGGHVFTEKCYCGMNHLDKWEAKFYHPQQEKMVYEKVFVHNPFGKYDDVKYIKQTFGEGGILLDNDTLKPI